MSEEVHPRSDSNFSISKLKKALKNEGNKRVSREAANALGQELEDYVEEVAEDALEIMESKDRVTVREEDIKEALDRK